MPSDHLTEAFKQAAEIAKSVPDHLQETAFNRALDAILGQTAGGAEGSSRSTNRKAAKLKGVHEQKDAEIDPTVVLLEHMDSTAYPQVHDASKILDQALVILRAARDDFEIDGLSSPQIAKVLTEKFRHKTSRQAVQMALASAGRMVDRVTPASGATYFRIMRPGETYLDNPPKESTEGEKNKKRRKVAKKNASKESTRSQAAEQKKTAVKKRGPSKKGAYAVVTELLRGGFFKTPRTLSAIIEHAANSLGYHLKTNELPAPLLRYLRDKNLKRAKNSDKQFEYSEA
jgi:hypothetical protein